MQSIQAVQNLKQECVQDTKLNTITFRLKANLGQQKQMLMKVYNKVIAIYMYEKWRHSFI